MTNERKNYEIIFEDNSSLHIEADGYDRDSVTIRFYTIDESGENEKVLVRLIVLVSSIRYFGRVSSDGVQWYFTHKI